MKIRSMGTYRTRAPWSRYSLHGSLDIPLPFRSLGIDPDELGIDTNEKAAAYIAKFMEFYPPEELEMHIFYHGFCGTICFTLKE